MAELFRLNTLLGLNIIKHIYNSRRWALSNCIEINGCNCKIPLILYKCRCCQWVGISDFGACRVCGSNNYNIICYSCEYKYLNLSNVNYMVSTFKMYIDRDCGCQLLTSPFTLLKKKELSLDRYDYFPYQSLTNEDIILRIIWGSTTNITFQIENATLTTYTIQLTKPFVTIDVNIYNGDQLTVNGFPCKIFYTIEYPSPYSGRFVEYLIIPDGKRLITTNKIINKYHKDKQSLLNCIPDDIMKEIKNRIINTAIPNN
jgi:hypothetical protein